MQDRSYACSQFPEDFRQRWNILAAARTFAEDIPPAIFQALLIIYGSGIQLFSYLWFQCRNDTEGIHGCYQPSPAAIAIGSDHPRAGFVDSAGTYPRKCVFPGLCQSLWKCLWFKKFPVYGTQPVSYRPLAWPLVLPEPAAMASACAGPEHPVAAMSAGMYGPPPPTVGAPGAADGTANKNAPPEVKAPPVAEGMNTPDSLEVVSAMDPRLGIGFSVENGNHHFEPDHLLQAMECKTLRPKGQPVSLLSARPPAKDEPLYCSSTATRGFRSAAPAAVLAKGSVRAACDSKDAMDRRRCHQSTDEDRPKGPKVC